MDSNDTTVQSGSGATEADAPKVYATEEDWMNPTSEMFTFEDVPMPELGPGKVQKMRGMTPGERDRWETERTPDLLNLKAGEIPPATERNRNMTAGVLARCMVRATGERMFPEDDTIHFKIERLSNAFPISVMNRLWQVAARLSFIDPEAGKRAKGNSNGARSSGGSAT